MNRFKCHITPTAALLWCVLLFSASLLTPTSAMKAYSESEAWRYHYYVRATDCDIDPVDLWTCGPACASLPDFQTYTVLNNNDAGTRGFIGVDHNHSQIVVAFRGSDNLQNWLANILLVQTPYDRTSSCGNNCKVHTGFMLSYLSVRAQTRAAVLALLSAYPSYGIVATGHSLGGALATLAAADLQELLNNGNYTTTPQTLTLYTFGAPRVGNVAFAQWLVDLLADGATYRITHARDPVVRLPFRSWDYAHVTHEVFYKNLLNSSRVMCVDTVTKQDKKCSAGKFSVLVLDHLFYMGENTMCDCASFNPKTQVPSLTWKMYLQLSWEYTKSFF